MLEIPLNLIFPQAALFLFPALLMNLLKVCAKKKKKTGMHCLGFSFLTYWPSNSII